MPPRKNRSRRPRQDLYRHLTMRRGRIYYKRRVGGRRVRFSLETDDWDVAAKRRDVYERERHINSANPLLAIPTVAEFANRYLEEDIGHLASTTSRDRKNHFREGGAIMRHLGELPLNAVSQGVLREWWNAEILRGGRKPGSTGMRYVSALSRLFRYAVELELLPSNPIRQFREQLTLRARTKSGRAEAESSQIRAVEDPATLSRLLAEAEAESPALFAFTLLLLDAGLRQGEALAMRWGRIQWEERKIIVDATRSRGHGLEPPKSGRRRRVQMSQRLRAALLKLREERGLHQLQADELLFPSFDGANLRHRDWPRIVKRAKALHRDGKPVRMKDLRDTYASWLVSAGVPIQYVARQLGHAGTQVTEKSYARWVGGDEYIEPPRLCPGEVPADLLARLEKDSTCVPDLRVDRFDLAFPSR